MTWCGDYKKKKKNVWNKTGVTFLLLEINVRKLDDHRKKVFWICLPAKRVSNFNKGDKVKEKKSPNILFEFCDIS